MKKQNDKVSPVLNEFFAEYLPNTKGLRENSILAYKYAFRLLFGYLQEEKGIDAENVTFKTLSGGTVESFLLYLEKQRKCSVKTRNIRRAAIVAFAKFAAKKHFDISLPFYSAVIEMPRKREPKTKTVKYFTTEEVSLLLNLPNASYALGQRDVTLLSLLYASGARVQEICDLTLSGISFGNPTKIKLIGKGGKPRSVTIPDNCAAILTSYLKSMEMDVRSKGANTKFLFQSQRNPQMSLACVEEIVEKYVTQAKKKYPDLFKQKRYTPHSFRHSIAVHMLEAGESLVSIKAFLGHASIATTVIYAQVSPELANRYLDERGKPLPEEPALRKPQPLAQALPFLY